MLRFENKVSVVVGAANGIGCEIAHQLGTEGSLVVLVDYDRQDLSRVETEFRAAGLKVASVCVDISDAQQVKSLVQQTIKTNGKIDILVNSAGVFDVAGLFETKDEAFDRSFRVNVNGAFYLMREVGRHMADRREGRIVNIASWYGKRGHENALSYCASKAAMISLTQSAAMDLAKFNVNVNSVCPGTIVNTKMRRDSDQFRRARGLPTAEDQALKIPLGRVGVPADVAEPVLFLCSDAARYMTGQSINVTGGVWMH